MVYEHSCNCMHSEIGMVKCLSREETSANREQGTHRSQLLLAIGYRSIHSLVSIDAG